MNDKACILLDIVDGKAAQVVQVLQEIPGVVMVETLEGPPNAIIVMEAVERKQFAKLTVQVLALVRTMTEHAHLLLEARDRLNTITFPKLSSQTRSKNTGSREHEG